LKGTPRPRAIDQQLTHINAKSVFPAQFGAHY
jgi:hypothetical protein